MVGLSIVLESNSSPQVISKVSISSPSSVSSPHYFSNSPTASTFLDVCSLCKKKLFPGQEIYMYQGDRAFCSSECRSIQIFMDEERLFAAKNCCYVAASDARSPFRRQEHQ